MTTTAPGMVAVLAGRGNPPRVGDRCPWLVPWPARPAIRGSPARRHRSMPTHAAVHTLGTTRSTGCGQARSPPPRTICPGGLRPAPSSQPPPRHHHPAPARTPAICQARSSHTWSSATATERAHDPRRRADRPRTGSRGPSHPTRSMVDRCHRRTAEPHNRGGTRSHGCGRTIRFHSWNAVVPRPPYLPTRQRRLRALHVSRDVGRAQPLPRPLQIP